MRSLEQPTIYLDVLILTNLFVTYFLLLSTKGLLHLVAESFRMVSAALLGGIYSMIILIPNIPSWLLNLLKLIFSVLLVAVAFGMKNKRLLLKNVIVFYGINFIYAGFMFAMWYFITPIGMIYKNGIVYFNVSAVVLAISTVAAYLVIRCISYLLSKNVKREQLTELELSCNGRMVLLSAFIDTGNRLVDILSGLPVVVCEFEAITDLIPSDLQQKILTFSLDQIENQLWKKRFRIIPVQAVTGSSAMVAFKPDSCFLITKEGGHGSAQKHQKEVMVGISKTALSQGEFSALIGGNLMDS